MEGYSDIAGIRQVDDKYDTTAAQFWNEHPDVKSATGLDKISLVKHMLEPMIRVLLFAPQFMLERLVPIVKDTSVLNLPDKSRPIAVSSIFVKVLELYYPIILQSMCYLFWTEYIIIPLFMVMMC